MSVIYTGRPVPLNGKQKLSGREAAQRAKAMDCIRSSESTQCQGQVHVGLFFDGTGNNDAWVEDGQTQTQRERNKHSNVARLFDAHLNEPENGFFRYYLPGVGTPFKDIGDTSKWLYDNLGMGLGYRGADRINYGIVSILNAASLYLNKAPLLSNSGTGALAASISADAMGPISTEGAMRWAVLTTIEERLASVIRAHQRKLTQINVSIFGFSRGAAEARACAYWLSQICERNGGGMRLAGVPLRIGFMGIFDTVAAVGIGDVTPFTEGHMAWADGTQGIHPAVEDCVHFIALHEQRASFPLEAAVGRGNIAYPGMHSDVGGGYFPGEQGKAMPDWAESPHLSQIPLLDMHFAAIKAGVPMMTIEQVMADARLRKSFATDEELLKIYNTWLANHGVTGGDAQAYTEAHARHYIRWRAQLHLNHGKGIAEQNFFSRAKAGSDQSDMQKADESLRLQLNWLIERRAANATVRGYIAERLRDVIRLTSPMGTFLVEPGKAPLTAYERKFIEIAADGPPPPPGCAELFADYVHDSRAGFKPLGMHEPIVATGGYLRFRHVFKEEIHRESRLYGWANEGLSAAKVAGNAVAQFLSDLWDASITAYRLARQRIAEAGHAAIQSASNAYQAAENRVLRDYQQAERELYRQLRLRYPGPL
jgi:Uncharacterized alpha/beta hydrolase domain (DUF2235)